MILNYHRIVEAPDPLLNAAIDRAMFERHMKTLAARFKPVGLRTGLQALWNGDLPYGSVAVTFDDGYADNLTLALPILERFAIPATIFVATGFLNGGRMWNDTVVEAIRRTTKTEFNVPSLDLPRLPLHSPGHRAYVAGIILQTLKYQSPALRNQAVETIAEWSAADLPDDMMLTSDQLMEIKERGVEIGAHTVSHPILGRLPDDSARREIQECRDYLTHVLGGEVRGFAYPNGIPGTDFNHLHMKMVAEAGFDYAVTTARGVGSRTTHPFALPRFGPWHRSARKFMARLVREFAVDGASGIRGL